ncbi:hypothetical protein [Nostoc sp. TCL26-01]|uniref:hypothetical protein n=1 Tax=Nostoc sp. TCL26-01 TaxID=2576904 RepID=UPI001C4C7463|nr:hypothetical protein [Nostoc sp. TCL26-01]
MAFLQLSRPTLLKLATALENGRLSPPFLVSTIANYVPATLSQTVVDELNRLIGESVKCSHIAYTLRLLAAERSTSQPNAILKQVCCSLTQQQPKRCDRSLTVWCLTKSCVLFLGFDCLCDRLQ